MYYAVDSAWHQSERGSELEIGPLSVIDELDPTGANGDLLEVLCLFAKSLDPLLTLLDEQRGRGSASGSKFEARKLSSAATQMGALRLAAACNEITRHFASDEFRSAPSRLDLLGDHVITETVRVQRRLHRLLADASGPH